MKRLTALPPAKRMLEFGRLEERLRGQTSAPPPATTRVPKLPEPVRPVTSTSGQTDDHINSQGQFTGSYAQWKALRSSHKIM